MRRIRSRRYSWGSLTLSMDASQASAPIFYGTDGDQPESWTPFQTADARHSWAEAFRLVNEWLASQAG